MLLNCALVSNIFFFCSESALNASYGNIRAIIPDAANESIESNEIIDKIRMQAFYALSRSIEEM